MIALNAAVWWMLTLPRTILTVRRILMLNAFISAFYGLFPLAYLVGDGVFGILEKGHEDLENLEIISGNRVARQMLVISASREGLFGGGSFGDVAAKVVFRLLPLFLSISAIEDLVGLDFYLKGPPRTKPSQVAAVDAATKKAPEENKQDTDNNTTAKATEVGDKEEAAVSKALDRMVRRMSHKLAESRNYRGLPKWNVAPAIAIVLTVILAMCGRLATLTKTCGGSPQQQHWMGRWCVYQAFPLFTTMPGSSAECACAVLFVRGATNNTIKSALIKQDALQPGQTVGDPCDQNALTQLHDDIAKNRDIAKYVQTLLHYCPMQNTTQTDNILAAKLDSVATVMLWNPSGAHVSNMAGRGVELQLHGLPSTLLTFTATNVPIANPSLKTFEKLSALV